ncbi:MAG: Ada metal-binding domain-containing protein [Cloacibacillus porcorum]|nr:Ada metal-binding domain-containing protein [Cloacibacillus porcorum]MDD7649229.1 Ada metal-binding domain-containing protein [Cloacibacillus porcorum]
MHPVSASDNTIVYVTRTGSKYHRDGCGSLSRSKIEITLKDAKAEGYTPCKRCNPPR